MFLHSRRHFRAFYRLRHRNRMSLLPGRLLLLHNFMITGHCTFPRHRIRFKLRFWALGYRHSFLLHIAIVKAERLFLRFCPGHGGLFYKLAAILLLLKHFPVHRHNYLRGDLTRFKLHLALFSFLKFLFLHHFFKPAFTNRFAFIFFTRVEGERLGNSNVVFAFFVDLFNGLRWIFFRRAFVRSQ